MRGAALLVIVVSLGVSQAQQPQFNASTSLVRLDAGVIDDNGPVRGLHPEDFVVEDMGAKQAVRVEEYVDAPLDLVLVAPPVTAVAYTSAEQVPRVSAGLSAFLGGVQERDRLGVVMAGAPPTRLRPLEFGRPAFDLQVFSGGNDAAPFDGIAAALRLFDQSDRRRALVAFTNAADFRSVVTFPMLTDLARRLGPAFVLVGAPVRFIAAAGSRAELTTGASLADGLVLQTGTVFPTTLQLLARRTGGITVDLGDGDPAQSIARMFSWLRRGYLISYEPPAGKGWHRVTVKVNRRGARVSVREGYVVD
ncbi:MAG TPA: hypothetical protein VJN96_01795 [Vicinamibacterales bacterium]|nr:hypothetical protein [Vicinamibacterales bacterium]